MGGLVAWFVEDLREVESEVAEGTLDLETRDRPVLKFLSRFALHNWVYDVVVFVVFVLLGGGVLVFLAVDSKALSHEVNVDALDVLYQPRDGRQQLLGDVPLGVQLHRSLLLECLLILVRVEGHVANRQLLLVLDFSDADDVRNEVVDQVGIALSLALHPQRHLHVRQTLWIGILAWISGELLGDDVLLERDFAALHFLANV